MAGKKIQLLVSLLCTSSILIASGSVYGNAEDESSLDESAVSFDESVISETTDSTIDDDDEETDEDIDKFLEEDDINSNPEKNSDKTSELSEQSSEISVDIHTFDVDENVKQRSELIEENSEIQQELSDTKKEIKEKRALSKKLQKQISELSEKIKTSNKNIKTLNEEIKEKQTQIDEKTSQIEDRLNMLRKRLHAIHLSGDTTSLEVILGASDFSDFLDKSQMIQSISEYDDTLISSLQDEMNIISSQQKTLRQDKSIVEEEKKQLEINKKKINELNDENTKIINELKDEAKELIKGIENNNNMQKQLEDALSKYNKALADQARIDRMSRMQQYLSENPEIVVESTGGFVWPCPGYTNLTSTFDEWRGANNHGALDIAEGGIYGAKVVACYDGVVFSTCTYCSHDYGKEYSCGCGGGYGNYVMIDHGNGKISIYGHLSGVTVADGQHVVAGQLIGYVGSTGYSTGAHLHFEMRYNGIRYDPLTEY